MGSGNKQPRAISSGRGAIATHGVEPRRIEPAAPGDIAAVAEVDLACFSRPWPREVFVEELTRAHSGLHVGRVGTGCVAAYSLYWRICDEIHLLRMATSPEHRRQGWGRRLLEHLILAARSCEASRILLEVRESNLAAFSLYVSVGFCTEGRRRHYYDNQEDALLMGLHLADHDLRAT